ncbi:MAG: hypothetical protein KZQ58_06805 [gamma proteobacterium symbiont of Bathyaustriella thionipta]|nr:hypothetical protein [gamma proteobacterium symbiont of Bathyaustriella thionipta]
MTGYILIVTLVLTWSVNVNQIIAYASRAFALFYALQCMVAFSVAWQNKQTNRRGLRLIRFALLAVLCFMVFTFGLPSG